MNIKNKVLEYKDDMIKDIIELVNIDSVLDESAVTQENPFGEGVTKGFNIVADKAKALGWETTNVKNMAMDVTIGKKSDDYIGLVVHMDVVPAIAANWSNGDPFQGYSDGEYLYGRGSQDDKGPLVSLFYAMKIIEEMNVPLKRSIRLVIGGNEETYHKGITEYFKHNEFPTASFTADSEFPLTYVEKGGSSGTVLVDKPENLIDFQAGVATNAVAAKANVKVKAYDGIELDFEKFLQANTLKGIALVEDGIASLEIEGEAAHGSIPHEGVSAINMMAKFLKDKFNNELIQFINDKFTDKFYGEGFGLTVSDEDAVQAGQVSSNIGIISVVGDKVEIKHDIRYPSTHTPEYLLDTVKKVYTESFKNLEFKLDKLSKPLYIPLDSPLASTLLNVYQEVTGDTSTKPIISGGGTYAKEIPNCLAYGLMFPQSEQLMHAPDERLNIQELLTGTEIFVKAIIELANKDF